MKANTTNIPALRFKDENGNNYPDWQKKKLGQIGDIISGLTYSPNDISEDGVLVLRSSNVQNRSLSFEDNVFVNTDNYNPVDEGDILICVRNGSKNLIGKNAIISKEFQGLAFGAFMSVYRSPYNSFLFHWFDTEEYSKAVHKNLGATINSINSSDLKKFIVPFPSLPEQQKIADFLTAVDERIQQLTKKKQLLEQYKKGVMQQLFSQQLRFKDENGNNYPDWEEKKLGDVYEITSSKRVFKEEWTNKGVPFYRTREIVQLSENGYVANELYISREMYDEYKNKYGAPKKNDLLVTAVGTIGIMYHVNDETEFYFKDGNVIWFKSLEKANSKYINQLFKSSIVQNQITGSASITTVGTYTIVNAKKTKVPFPNLPEQQKIADFLSSIDSKIELVQKQIDKTQAFKKGLLQQMFV